MRPNPYRNHSTADIEAVIDHYERTKPETRWRCENYIMAMDEINRRFEMTFHQMQNTP